MVERSKASIFVLDQEGEEEVPSSRQRPGNFSFASCLRLDCGVGAGIACQEEANGKGRTWMVERWSGEKRTSYSEHCRDERKD